jgi:hypothetical protein
MLCLGASFTFFIIFSPLVINKDKEEKFLCQLKTEDQRSGYFFLLASLCGSTYACIHVRVSSLVQ